MLLFNFKYICIKQNIYVINKHIKAIYYYGKHSFSFRLYSILEHLYGEMNSANFKNLSLFCVIYIEIELCCCNFKFV